MGRPSTIENHPQYDRIAQLIYEGVPDKDIAQQVKPNVSHWAIRHHREKTTLHKARLASPPESVLQVNKSWAEAKYVSILDSALSGKRKDLPSARAVLDSICRLNGYDAPKRSESLTLNLHALQAGQLSAQLAGMLQSLPAHERKQLLASEPVLDVVADSGDTGE